MYFSTQGLLLQPAFRALYLLLIIAIKENNFYMKFCCSLFAFLHKPIFFLTKTSGVIQQNSTEDSVINKKSVGLINEFTPTKTKYVYDINI